MEDQGVILETKIMDRVIKRRDVKPKPYEFIIDVEYIPFPSEAAREEAYYTHAKLFLRAKMRQLMQKQQESKTEKPPQGSGPHQEGMNRETD